MKRAVMQHVATLAEAPQVGEPVVGRVVVKMRGGEHDAGQADLRGVDQVGPACRTPTPVAPCPRCLVEPATVWQTADLGQMRAGASLTAAASALKADATAQRRPVRAVT